jgi:hypothetical protein
MALFCPIAGRGENGNICRFQRRLLHFQIDMEIIRPLGGRSARPADTCTIVHTPLGEAGASPSQGGSSSEVAYSTTRCRAELPDLHGSGYTSCPLLMARDLL